MIGAPELFVLVLIPALIAGALFVLVRVITRIARNTPGAAGLVPCSGCKRPVSPRAASCPSCGEPGVTAEA